MSRKAKTSYNLEQMEYINRLIYISYKCTYRKLYYYFISVASLLEPKSLAPWRRPTHLRCDGCRNVVAVHSGRRRRRGGHLRGRRGRIHRGRGAATPN
jgi:hypothetical protein